MSNTVMTEYSPPPQQSRSPEQTPHRTPTEGVKKFFGKWNTALLGTIFTFNALVGGVQWDYNTTTGDTKRAAIFATMALINTLAGIGTAIHAQRKLNKQQRTIQEQQGTIQNLQEGNRPK